MEPEVMRELVLGWKRPDVDVSSVAAADLFGVEHSRVCEIELPLAQLTLSGAEDMSWRNVERSSLTATRPSINRDGVRVRSL
jgi:hypothetical protein